MSLKKGEDGRSREDIAVAMLEEAWNADERQTFIVSPELKVRYERWEDRQPHPTRCTGCKRAMFVGLKVCTEPYGVVCEGCARNLVGATR